MYTNKVMQHFREPKNMGEIENPDGVGKVGNIACGDVMWIYIKVKDDSIEDIKFKTYGCTAAIATSSMVTELVKGKKIKDALEVKKDDIVEELGGLPPIKVHCSILAMDALVEAVYDYYQKNDIEIPESLEKKHKKIEKEKKMLEEKYEGWM
jgi:nitrogen fixation NifU-like protein